VFLYAIALLSEVFHQDGIKIIFSPENNIDYDRLSNVKMSNVKSSINPSTRAILKSSDFRILGVGISFHFPSRIDDLNR